MSPLNGPSLEDDLSDCLLLDTACSSEVSLLGTNLSEMDPSLEDDRGAPTLLPSPSLLVDGSVSSSTNDFSGVDCLAGVGFTDLVGVVSGLISVAGRSKFSLVFCRILSTA